MCVCERAARQAKDRNNKQSWKNVLCPNQARKLQLCKDLKLGFSKMMEKVN